MNKVLLMTASFGDGHNQAASAVKEQLESNGATVKVVDYLEWLHPLLRKFTKISLIQGVKKLPSLYGAFYRYMAFPRPSSRVHRQLNHLGKAKMEKYIADFKPDVVACTFPTPAGVMSELRAEGVTTTPVAGIITDFTPNWQWVHPHTDLYFVPTEAVKEGMVSFGVPSERIEVTGIPIRSVFTFPQRRHELREKHGIDPERPLVLIMGGGEGLLGPDCEEIIARHDAQFAIICGRNERLYKRLQRLKSNRVTVLGYVKEMHEWMGMADLTITKAGGITVSEALSMELPMLLFHPIPGQEEKNAEFAVGTGAAILVHDVKAVHEFLDVIAENPLRLRQMSESARLAAKRVASKVIASRILQLTKGAPLPILESI